MQFARKVWHLLVAIKDGLVLLLMLLFFGVLFTALTARPSEAGLRDGALLVKLDGSVVEEPSEQDAIKVISGVESPLRQHRARDVARAIELAASDDHVKAVVLDLSKFTGGGLVHMEEIGAAMDKVRAAKKPVLTYATAYLDDGVMLAAHATEAWVHPMGGAFVTGPGGTMPYYGKLLKNYGVKVHVFKVGTFKDFVEPYERNDASAPSREARVALYAALWEDWKANVAKARPKARIEAITRDPVAWMDEAKGDAAQAAVNAGLIDRIGDNVAFGERVKELAGAGTDTELPGSYAFSRPDALLAAHPVDTGGKAVAVVTVAGDIVDGKAGPGTAGGDRVAKLIDKANGDDASALVLRVDSPGGSVLASEQIRGAIERFKAPKDGKARPVVVSMANVAASGGYWVSTPGQRIFAEPGTVTGSIGIFTALPSFEDTLARYGVNSDGVRTTPLSGQPDVLAGFTPEAEKLLQANIENGYARFIGLVAKSRGKTPEEVDSFAQGRVWDGGTARQKGLVDEFGGLPEALAYAAKAAKLETWHAKYYGTEPSGFGGLVAAMLGGDDANSDGGEGGDLAALLALRQQDSLARVAYGLTRLGQVQGMQALCLDCALAAPAPATPPPTGWGAMLEAVLRSR
ncbi:MAG: signal peptide peptidase SppA [Novosphingobium sp.]